MPQDSESKGWGELPLPALKRRAREFALQILFQSDTGGEPVERALASFWEERPWQSPAGDGGDQLRWRSRRTWSVIRWVMSP